MLDGEVTGCGVRLHYLEWEPQEGATQPALLLLHGTSSNALYWERLARHLPNRHIVALDQRGHSRSERASKGYTPSVMAADVKEAIEGLALRRPLVVGHSWGLAVALELAAADPALVSGVVLVDGPIASLADCMSWEDADREMRPPPPVYRDIAEAEEAQASFLQDAWGDDLRDFVRAGLIQTSQGWVPVLPEAGRLEMIRSLYYFQPERLLPNLQRPVLLAMASDPGDGVAPDVLACWRRGARLSAQLAPQAELVTYPSRHDIPLILPAELASDIEKIAVGLHPGEARQPSRADRPRV